MPDKVTDQRIEALTRLTQEQQGGFIAVIPVLLDAVNQVVQDFHAFLRLFKCKFKSFNKVGRFVWQKTSRRPVIGPLITKTLNNSFRVAAHDSILSTR